MEFADLVAPRGADRFMAEIYGRRPLHIPAADRPAQPPPLDWPRFNALLGVRSHWTPGHIELILNGRKVGEDLYLDAAETLGGRVRRADPAKVGLFLAMGASFVGNSIEDISPEARAVTAALAAQFSGRAGANLYCSTRGIPAFPSHCDPHEVFAVQCEGEKAWNIYANRAASPVDTLEGPDAQAIIDAVKGPVAMKVTMRPGDLLYIPRGFYHDALASSDASLHVTFSVAPLTGRILFALLEELAAGHEAFREYLPDARSGEALEQRIAELSGWVARLLDSPRLRTELELRQRALVDRSVPPAFPERAPLSFFARTQRKADLHTDDSGTSLACGGEEIALGALHHAALWLLGRPAFSIEELCVRFPECEAEGLRGLVDRLERMGLIVPYQPQL
jgi:hypothetical protein